MFQMVDPFSYYPQKLLIRENDVNMIMTSEGVGGLW